MEIDFEILIRKFYNQLRIEIKTKQLLVLAHFKNIHTLKKPDLLILNRIQTILKKETSKILFFNINKGLKYQTQIDRNFIFLK